MSIHLFSRDSSKFGGRYGMCKPCESERKKAKYHAHDDEDDDDNWPEVVAPSVAEHVAMAKEMPLDPIIRITYWLTTVGEMPPFLRPRDYCKGSSGGGMVEAKLALDGVGSGFWL